jgi:hypothetical protein
MSLFITNQSFLLAKRKNYNRQLINVVSMEAILVCSL